MKIIFCFLLGLLKVIGFILKANFWLLKAVGPYSFGGMIIKTVFGFLLDFLLGLLKVIGFILKTVSQ